MPDLRVFLPRLSALLPVLLLSQAATAQELPFARSAGAQQFDRGWAIAVDGTGDTFVTGSFQETVTFGKGEAHETTLTATGVPGPPREEVFIARYDGHTGHLRWVVQAGGPDEDEGLGLAVDGAGDVLVTGYFRHTAVFGRGEPNETTLTGAPGDLLFHDVFIAKYSGTDGRLRWAKRAGGTGLSDRGAAVAVDGDGNAVVTGLFSATATFGPGEPNETTRTADGIHDIFVAKYDGTDGHLLWAAQAGGSDTITGLVLTEAGEGIATDPGGDAFVTGYFQETAVFGRGEPHETTLAGDDLDAFVARYDGADGRLRWAKRAGGPGFDQGAAVTVDASGDAFVTGRFFGEATFGPDEANQTSLVAAGDFEAYVAKFAGTDGRLRWAKRAGGCCFDEGAGIAVDAAGRVLVTGTFRETATFGPGEAHETLLRAAGAFDVFVASYDGTTGDVRWVERAGGTHIDAGTSVAIDRTGDVFVTGYFYETAAFRSGETGPVSLTSAGVSDFFVAKYPAAPLHATPPQCAAVQLERDQHGRLTAIQTSVSDAESGIQRVVFSRLRNMHGFLSPGTGVVGPFTEGGLWAFEPAETPAVDVRAERIDMEAGGALVVTITSGVGQVSVCDPVFARIEADTPERSSLASNYPNPFNPSTTIRFSLSEEGPVRLAVYDLTGRLVATLAEEVRAAGVYEAVWTGQDEKGQALPSGTYFYRLEAGSFAETRAMTLLR